MRNIIVLFFLLISSFAVSQVNVGRSKSPVNLHSSKLKSETFDRLSSSKTIVVIPSDLDETKFKNIFEATWEITKYTFVSEVDFNQNKNRYIKEDQSIFLLDSDNYIKSKTAINTGRTWKTAEYISFRFILFFPEKIKKKKEKISYNKNLIGEIVFAPNIGLRTVVVYGSGRKTAVSGLLSKKARSANSEDPGFYTYKYGYIKNFLTILNDAIKNKQSLSMRDGYVDVENIKSLKSKTLYAPEWILKRYAAMSATLKEVSSPEEYFKNYTYEYKVISDEALNKMILDGEAFYYLIHTQYNGEKVLSILDAKNGKYIYIDASGGYNIKSSDLKSIVKAIEK